GFGVAAYIVGEEHGDGLIDNRGIVVAERVAEPARLLETDQRREPFVERLLRPLGPLRGRFWSIPAGGVEQAERLDALWIGRRKPNGDSAAHGRAADEG